jgi:hypothetical protein
MYNYYEPFLLDRYAGTLADVYGKVPCVELANRRTAFRFSWIARCSDVSSTSMRQVAQPLPAI